jgi:hypothetical protein
MCRLLIDLRVYVLPCGQEWKHMVALNLGDNDFSGTVPLDIYSIPFLSFLDISSNRQVAMLPATADYGPGPIPSALTPRGQPRVFRKHHCHAWSRCPLHVTQLGLPACIAVPPV